MRFARLTLGLCFLASFIAVRARSEGSQGVSASAVIREMNLARTNPLRYATFVEELRMHFRGNILVLPGRTILRTKEGVGALNGAIRFLHSVPPQPELTLSPGMCRAATDHCADQARGRMGHNGSDWSNPGNRLNRYGKWSTLCGENISYGKATAREIVLALIIDDGLSSRKHRKNIFNPTFSYSGAAYGPHAHYRSVCSIEFAGGFVERGQDPSETLFVRNP
jgi:uncharacterized protein YkwD